MTFFDFENAKNLMIGEIPLEQIIGAIEGAFGFVYDNILSIAMMVMLIAGGLFISIKTGFLQFGKFGYAMSKIFLSYDVIKYQYPILFKHKWLWLYANVRRWFKLVFGGSAKRSIRELKMNNDLSDDKANETESYLKKIGL